MQFICKKCRQVMRETVHFDFNNGKYEVRLNCDCKKGADHVYLMIEPSKVKMELGSLPG